MDKISKNDHMLIEAARNTSYLDWGCIFAIKEQAESESAKRIIDVIIRTKAHQEEAACGCM